MAAAKLIKDANAISTKMIGQLGNDDGGAAYVKYLQELGIDTQGVSLREDCVSG